MGSPPKWQGLGLIITRHVHRGQVTTFGDLSEAMNGHNRSSRAIGAMLTAWVTHDPRNCSHRVINDDGSVPPNEANLERLQKEGVAFDDEGKVVLEKHRAQLPPYEKKIAT